MNIFKFALEYEEEHKSFYLDCAEQVDNKGLKSVFKELAAEEEKHYNIVKQLKEEKEVEHVESNLLPKAKKAFEDLSVNMEEGEAFPLDSVDIYKKAEEMERQTHEFYKSKAEETDLAYVRKTFQELAREEKKHEEILHNLVELVNRPNTWLDDAEWYHFEDY